MKQSIRDIPKKRGRPKKDGRGIGVMVRVHTEDAARLDAWIAAQDAKVSRPEAIRRLVDMALREGALIAEPAAKARANKGK